MGLLTKSYRAVALLAVIHLGVLVAGLGWLGLTGRLTPETVKAVVDVMRQDPADDDAAVDSNGFAVDPRSSSDGSARRLQVDPERDELARRGLERMKLEAEHQIRLARRQMLEVKRREEAFDERLRQQAAEETERVEVESTAGFRKDLEIIGALNPKVALQNMLARPVPEAARMLAALDTRKAKRIIEAASKDPRQMAQMMTIQEHLRAGPSDRPAGGRGTAQDRQPADGTVTR